MRKIAGSVNEPIETTAKRVWTWREPVGALTPFAVQCLVWGPLYLLSQYFPPPSTFALVTSLAGPLALSFFINFTGYMVHQRCIEQLYRRYPPRSRYTPSEPLTVSTTSLPKCPPGIEATSVSQ